MQTPVRLPAVAGQFYPAQSEVLLREIKEYTSPSAAKIRAIGCVAPHAGYMYSGHVAGAVYSRIELPKRFVILCPNHTGVGMPLSIMSHGTWATPLGAAQIDTALAEAMKNSLPALEEDSTAHRSEHAIEVQVPFLQAMAGEITFVPIAVGTSRYPVLEALGQAVAAVVKAQSGEVLIVASSDMSHYEPDDVTRIKDRRAIDPMLSLDAKGLWEIVTTQHISMCGFGPAVAMLTAAKLLGATNSKLVKYATSGDISGDRGAVVGYAGVVVS